MPSELPRGVMTEDDIAETLQRFETIVDKRLEHLLRVKRQIAEARDLLEAGREVQTIAHFLQKNRLH